MRRRNWLIALAFATATSTAFAQAPTQQDADRLQHDWRTWFSTLLGPAMPLPEPPLAITAEGEGYAATLSLEGLTGRKQDVIAMVLRPAAGGTWQLDHLRLPPSGAITVPAMDPKVPDLTTDTTWDIGEQTARGLFDPTLRTRSTLSLEYRDVDVTAKTANRSQRQEIDRLTYQATLIPGADTRVDLQQEAAISGWTSATQVDDDPPVTVEVRRMRQSSRIDGLDLKRLGDVWSAFRAILSERAAHPDLAPGDEAMMRAQRPHLLAMIAALRDAAARMETGETFDDITLTLPGIGEGSLEQAHFGFGAEAPDGKLRAWLDVAFDSPSIPALPQNFVRFLPTRLVLRPAISGVSTEHLSQLLTDALADKRDEAKLTADAIALLTEPGANVGLEVLSLEINGVRIDAEGKLRLLDPGKPGVEAHVIATGLDALLSEAGKDPDLKAAMPMLLILRGMGRQDGNRVVWDLAVTEHQALVNGVDVMPMFGHKPPPGEGKSPRHQPGTAPPDKR